MKAFITRKFENDKIQRYLSRKIRKKGIINREKCESLEVHFNLLRPFRYVFWKCMEGDIDDEKTCVSLLDEDLASIVKDLDDQLLLWRPHYSNLNVENISLPNHNEAKTTNDDSHVQSIIDNLVKRRRKAMEVLEALGSDLQKMHRESMSASTLLLPKSPSFARKESQLIDRKKFSHSVVVATSLVANCSTEDIILSGKLGERIFVNTIAAEYVDISTQASRWLFLEFPGAKSINDAIKNGRALTRLYSLNKNYGSKINQLILQGYNL